MNFRSMDEKTQYVTDALATCVQCARQSREKLD